MSGIVVLTGATGHLGREILKRIVHDWSVICISRRPVDLALIDSTLHDRVISLRVDIKTLSLPEIVDMVEEVLSRKALKLSGLVNNSYFLDVSSYEDVSIDSTGLALKGLFAFHVGLSLEIIRRHLLLDPSSIINVSSMYAKVAPNPANYPDNIPINPLLYGAMKAALSQSTRYLSSIVAKKGIRVNSVSYGPFPSAEVQKKSPEFISRLASNTHLGRIGMPEESAGVIKFLLSGDSSYITGSDISVDGGWTAW